MNIVCFAFLAFLASVVSGSQNGRFVGVLSKQETQQACASRVGFIAAELCGNEFILCSSRRRGRAQRFQCVDLQQVFDEQAGSCVFRNQLLACAPPPTTPRPRIRAPPRPKPPQILDCGPLPDGNYEDPRSTCSQFYIACWDGIATLLNCAPGIAYDVISDRCLPPTQVQWCDEYVPPTEAPVRNPVPPKKVNPVPPRKVNPVPPRKVNPVPPTASAYRPNAAPGGPSSQFCSGQLDGSYGNGCSRSYVLCSGGYESVGNCAGGTFFDELSGDCLFRRFVQACGGNPTQPPIQSDAGNVQQPPSFPFDCSQLPDGNYEHPTDGCSAEYVSCRDGDALQSLCQEELAYDAVSDKCLEPQFVPWCPGGVATVATISPLRDPSARPFEFDCWGKEDGYYENPINRCSSQYVSCVGQEPLFMECPGNLRFDIWAQFCHNSIYIESCGGTPTTTAEQTTQQPRNPGIFFECAGKPDGDYEDPSEVCSRAYFSCSGGESSYRVCPGNLRFDVISGDCLEERWVEWCNGESTTTLAPRPALQQNPPFSYDCSARPDGDYDHPSNPCTDQYVSCSGGDALFRECPRGLVYDWDFGQCLAEAYVVGCGGSPTEAPEEAPLKNPANYDCIGLPDGAYARDDCAETYFACVGGIAEEMWCPGGVTVFDVESGDCLLPSFVRGCGGNPTKPPTAVPNDDRQTAEECVEDGPGLYAADSGCSRFYYICGPGDNRIDQECAQGTFFDIVSKQCLFRRDVQACAFAGAVPKGVKPRPVRPQAVPTKRPPPTPSKFPGCDATTPDGIYGDQCASSFVLCFSGQLSSGSCPTGRLFVGQNGQGRCAPASECPQ